MNSGRLLICLVGITPSNNPGTERGLLPYMVGNSLVLPWMVMGAGWWNGPNPKDWCHEINLLSSIWMLLLKILYRNAMVKVLLLNVLLYILYQIINKIYVKVIIAQNTLICPVLTLISMFWNVLQKYSISKHWYKVQYRTNQSHSELLGLYIFFIYYYVQDM